MATPFFTPSSLKEGYFPTGIFGYPVGFMICLPAPCGGGAGFSRVGGGNHRGSSFVFSTRSYVMRSIALGPMRDRRGTCDPVELSSHGSGLARIVGSHLQSVSGPSCLGRTVAVERDRRCISPAVYSPGCSECRLSMMIRSSRRSTSACARRNTSRTCFMSIGACGLSRINSSVEAPVRLLDGISVVSGPQRAHGATSTRHCPRTHGVCPGACSGAGRGARRRGARHPTCHGAARRIL